MVLSLFEYNFIVRIITYRSPLTLPDGNFSIESADWQPQKVTLGGWELVAMGR